MQRQQQPRQELHRQASVTATLSASSPIPTRASDTFGALVCRSLVNVVGTEFSSSRFRAASEAIKTHASEITTSSISQFSQLVRHLKADVPMLN